MLNGYIKDLHEYDQRTPTELATLAHELRSRLAKDQHTLVDRMPTSVLARRQLIELLAEKHLQSC